MTSDTDMAMGRKRTVKHRRESSATIYVMVVVESRTSTVTATMAILSTAFLARWTTERAPVQIVQ